MKSASKSSLALYSSLFLSMAGFRAEELERGYAWLLTPVEICILELLSHDDEVAEERAGFLDGLEHSDDDIRFQSHRLEGGHEIVHGCRVSDDEYIRGCRRGGRAGAR